MIPKNYCRWFWFKWDWLVLTRNEGPSKSGSFKFRCPKHEENNFLDIFLSSQEGMVNQLKLHKLAFSWFFPCWFFGTYTALVGPCLFSFEHIFVQETRQTIGRPVRHLCVADLANRGECEIGHQCTWRNLVSIILRNWSANRCLPTLCQRGTQVGSPHQLRLWLDAPELA